MLLWVIPRFVTRYYGCTDDLESPDIKVLVRIRTEDLPHIPAATRVVKLKYLTWLNMWFFVTGYESRPPTNR